jgi:hypothetical protein
VPVVEHTTDEVVAIVLGLLIVVGQHDVVLGRRRRGRLPCSTRRIRACMRWRWTERVVPVAEESRLPPRIRLDPALVEASVGVDGVGGVGAEVRRQVHPHAPDLHGLLWITRGYRRDRHLAVAEPLAVGSQVHVPLVAARDLVGVHQPRHVNG